MWRRVLRLAAGAGMSLTAMASPTVANAVGFVKSSVNLPASLVAFEVNSDLDGDGLNDAFAVYQRRIMVFFQTPEGRFPSAPDIEIGGEEPIPERYAAVAIGKVSTEPGRQLLLIGSRGVDFISFANLKSGGQGPVEPRNLIVEDLTISARPELVYLHCATDMDGDGSPELVLPVGESLAVYTSSDGAPYQRTSRVSLAMQAQQATSLDSEPMLLGSAFFSQPGTGSNVRLLPEPGVWHSVRFANRRAAGPLLITDFNQDRRMDILSAGITRYQSDDDTFSAQQSNAYQKVMTATVPHQWRNVLVTAPNLADFNGDKVWDTYGVEVTAAKLSPRTDLSVFLGTQNNNIPNGPNQVLRTRDFAYSDAIPIGDINNDGAQDIALFHLDFQPSSMQSQLKAYLRNGLQGDLRFYLYDKKNNRFPDSPSFKHPVTVSYEIYGARQFFRQQVAIDKDLTGDGYPDLVLKTGAMEFSVFENQNGTGFSRSPAAVVSTAPTRFSSIQTLDVNNDSLADVVISGYLENQEDRIIYSIFTSRTE